MRILISITLMAVLMAVIPATAGDYDENLREGIEAVNKEDIYEARRIFMELIEIEPARPEALCGLAIADIKKAEYSSAREHLLDAMKMSAGYAQVYYLLGLVEEQLRNYSPAAEYYAKYLDLSPEWEHSESLLNKIEYTRLKADE